MSRRSRRRSEEADAERLRKGKKKPLADMLANIRVEADRDQASDVQQMIDEVNEESQAMKSLHERLAADHFSSFIAGCEQAPTSRLKSWLATTSPLKGDVPGLSARHRHVMALIKRRESEDVKAGLWREFFSRRRRRKDEDDDTPDRRDKRKKNKIDKIEAKTAKRKETKWIMICAAVIVVVLFVWFRVMP